VLDSAQNSRALLRIFQWLIHSKDCIGLLPALGKSGPGTMVLPPNNCHWQNRQSEM